MTEAEIRDDLGGLNVHDRPNGKILDALAPYQQVFTTGAAVHTDTVTWAEILYHDGTKEARGWVRQDDLVEHPLVVEDHPTKPVIEPLRPEAEIIPLFRNIWEIISLLITIAVVSGIAWMIGQWLGLL